MTICQSVLLVLMAASFLTACSPTTNNNNHDAGKAGMSGGGATKDPGNGTGGGDSGGGGQGIQCGESKNSKISNRLFVRDVYEALSDQKLQIKSIPNDSTGSDEVSAEAIKVLVSSIKSYFGPASPNLEFTNENFWKNFSKKVSFIDDDRQLHASQDANSPIALPNECRVVQIAYWSDTSGEMDGGTLYVSAKYWRQLDQLNKVALLAHEFFFKQARRARYENSDTVRFKVGQMLSANGVRHLFDQWMPSMEERAKEIMPESMNGFKICQGSSSEEPAAKIHFYQYEGKDGRQHFSIPLLTSSSINLSYLNDSQFSFDPKENPDLAASTDLLIYPPFFYLTMNETDTYTFNKEYKFWFRRWYSNIGVLEKGEASGRITSFVHKFSNAIKRGDTFWSGDAGPSYDPVKIELLNHTHLLKEVENKTPKSREELVNTLHREIKQTIRNCTKANGDQITSAILLLDKEIREFINMGTLPDKFPQWTTALQSLGPWTSNSTQGADLCQYSKNTILNTLPKALLSVSANNYDGESLVPVLGTRFYMEDNSPRKAVPGLIRVSQSNRKLDFNLICKDYRQVYFNNFGIKNGLKTELTVQDKVVAIAPLQDIKAENTNETTTQTNSNYKKINSLLSFSKNGPQNFQHLISAYNHDCQKNDWSKYQVMSCPHYESFLSELSSEKSIQLKLCPKPPVLQNEGGSGNIDSATCVIAKMKSTQNTYMIYFNIAEDATLEIQYEPTIELVRMVPST